MSLKKKLAAAALVTGMMIPMAATTASAATGEVAPIAATIRTDISCYPGMYVNIDGPANLRSGPGTRYRVLRSIPNGASVRVVDCGGGYYWWHVTYRGTTGYTYGGTNVY